jgi:hypothetical protein
MFKQGSGVKLVDELQRDAQGKSSGGLKGRPTYIAMIDPLMMTPALEPYRHVPQYVDDCWAGQETIYLKFTTEAEARAKLGKHLA